MENLLLHCRKGKMTMELEGSKFPHDAEGPLHPKGITEISVETKGFFKGMRYISRIFVFEEHETVIGYPTDVRHVAHIGWDGASVNASSWMSEFKTASDFSTTSLSNFCGQSRESSRASQDFDQPRGLQLLSETSTRWLRKRLKILSASKPIVSYPIAVHDEAAEQQNH